MAKKKRGRPKTNRDDVTTKIDRAIYDMAFSVARLQKKPVAQLLSEALERPIRKMFMEMNQEMERKMKEAGE